MNDERLDSNGAGAAHRRSGSTTPTSERPPAGAVDARNLVKTFLQGDVAIHAVDDLDIRIAPGTFVVVLGPSGSGKTTLLNLLGGMDAPDQGSISVDGLRLERLDEAELTEYRRSTVGFVFQMFDLVPTLTALENVELIAELTGHQSDAAELLRRVGLEERGDAFPAALSGGEQQRVGIARALAKQPSLLLCDEPTGSLDLDTGREVLGLLRSMNRDRGLTTIVVTHNTAIADMADRVVTMRSGAIVEDRDVPDPIPPHEVRW